MKYSMSVESKYEKGDVVAFEKRVEMSKGVSMDVLLIGVIQGGYYDCDTFWYDIEVNSTTCLSYMNFGDVSEGSIKMKLDPSVRDIIKEI